MKKCFDAIYRLDFGSEGSKFIAGIISPEGEKINLMKQIKAAGEVEKWLASLEEQMRLSL